MIHIFERDGEVAVWTDCEPESEEDGRCLGVGKTRRAAMRAAMRELAKDMVQLSKMIAKEFPVL